ncbi:hypothetical protein PAP_04625 [Palaeococcus pacificus DY20341]|uniref:Uncharacterized protein n=1 Tax=Palaeococcus pacificus DY20341 TaxID=1343739 RepID=A0A075LT82_9EURY|nr:hypothetical protein [Palaeococcus pacificus]AIF69336.1 hypothetical protein PAP_04625 [Palaeococcus pacificus DY20341]
MRLVIKPDKGWGKIRIEIPDEVWKKIEKLSEEYGVPAENIIEIILFGEFKEPQGELETLEREIEKLKLKAAELEKEWAPLRYKAYGVSEDNKILAIELNGLLAENIQLKRFLRKKTQQDWELRRKIEYYLR